MKGMDLFRACRGLLAGGLLLGVSLSGAIVDRIVVMSEMAGGGYMPESLSQRVQHIIRTRENTELSDAILNDDLKELMLSGSFDNVRVEKQPKEDGRVELRFYVTPKPVVASVRFEGNQEYDDDKLRSIIEDTLTAGVPLEERTKAAARKAILDKYQDAGYWGTEVTTTEEKTADGHSVNVVIVVREKPRYKLLQTFFEGATVFDEGDLRGSLYTQRQWWRYIIRFGNYFNENLLPMDKDALKKKYHNAGYLDFEVEEVRCEPVEENTWMKVTYCLQEGSPYTVSGIKVVGATKIATEKLEALSELKAGDVYSAAKESLSTSLIKSHYGALGYLEIQVWAVQKKDSAAHTVALEYHVKEGEIIRIKDIKIVGNDTTQEKVIRRELVIHPEDLGDPDKLDTSKAILMNLGYFSKVDIVPAVTERADMRDLRISLEEKPTGNVSVGAAYSTEDSVLGQFEFVETNFDLARLLKLEFPAKGGGQRFRSRVQIGSDVSNVSIGLEEPWFLDRRLSLSTELFLRKRYEHEYDQRNVGAQMMLSWPIAFRIPFTHHVERAWRMGVGIRAEHVRISDCDNYHDTEEDFADVHGDFIRNRVIADEEDSYWANRLLWKVTRDTRDAFRFPKSGSIVEFQAEYVTKALGSYEDYMRFNLAGSKYYGLPGGRILKLGLGMSTTTDDDKVAIFDRYFGGGVGTIRGFKRRDVSPVDRHEDPLGGNTIWTGTVEVLQPVKDFMYASVFSDIGNVLYDSSDFDLSDYCMSVGVGLQFKAVPVSLYYGIPVAESYDHLEGKHGRFHFNIGFTY